MGSKRYEIVSEIKKTSFTEVYKAYHKELQRFCLLKSISKNYPDEFVTRFKEEAKTCASVDHPDAVKIYEIFEKDDKIFVSYEWVEGYDLSRIIDICERIEPDIALYIIYKILDVLEYVHKRGIIHRDIKPSNILISKEGFVKLTDFGIAKGSDSPELTKPGVVIGTPYYMSPEQVKGEKLSPSSDIFSLGATLYEMLTGKKAFSGKDTTQILVKVEKENPPFSGRIFKGINRKVKRILKKALEKKPEKRYKNAEEFKKDIVKVIGKEKILYGKKLLKDFINDKTQILETQTMIERPVFKDKKKKIKKAFLIPLFILLSILIFSAFYLYKKLFYPQIYIEVPFTGSALKLNNRFVNVPFKGMVPPGELRVELVAPFYVYKGLFYLKPREKREIEIPYITKDSLRFHFRGEGEVFINHKKVGRDSIDYPLKSGMPYLFIAVRGKDTISFYLPGSEKDVIWFQMPFKE